MTTFWGQIGTTSKCKGIKDLRNHPSNNFALQDRLVIYPTDAGNNFCTGVLPAQIVSVNGGREDSGS